MFQTKHFGSLITPNCSNLHCCIEILHIITYCEVLGKNRKLESLAKIVLFVEIKIIFQLDLKADAIDYSTKTLHTNTQTFC